MPPKGSKLVRAHYRVSNKAASTKHSGGGKTTITKTIKTIIKVQSSTRVNKKSSSAKGKKK